MAIIDLDYLKAAVDVDGRRVYKVWGGNNEVEEHVMAELWDLSKSFYVRSHTPPKGVSIMKLLEYLSGG